MISLLDVSYVRLGTRDIEGAARFAVGYLGLEVSEHRKGAICFKSDAREHTLCYFEGNSADQAVAFEVRGKDDLDAAASELERLGHAVRSGTESEAAARHVRGFIAFKDPSGNGIELVGPRIPANATTAAATPASPDSVMSASAHPMSSVMSSSGPPFATPASPIVSAMLRCCVLMRYTIRSRCFHPTAPESSTSTIRSRPATT